MLKLKLIISGDIYYFLSRYFKNKFSSNYPHEWPAFWKKFAHPGFVLTVNITLDLLHSKEAYIAIFTLSILLYNVFQVAQHVPNAQPETAELMECIQDMAGFSYIAGLTQHGVNHVEPRL